MEKEIKKKTISCRIPEEAIEQLDRLRKQLQEYTWNAITYSYQELLEIYFAKGKQMNLIK